MDSERAEKVYRKMGNWVWTEIDELKFVMSVLMEDRPKDYPSAEEKAKRLFKDLSRLESEMVYAEIKSE